MILSLTVYFTLAITLYILARGAFESAQPYKNNYITRVSPFWNWQILASILIFAIICGVRYNVGVDNLSYIDGYLFAQRNGYIERTDIEPLFAWIELSMASNGFHYSVFNGLWAALQITFIYYALRNDLKYLPYVALMIVLSPIYLKWMNGVRQCVVECVFFFLIEYIEKKQMWKYMLGVLICTTIHTTAIFLLPMYFLFQKPKYFSQWWLRILIFLGCTYLGSLTSWFESMTDLTSIIEFVGYDKYANRMDVITSQLNETKVWGPEKTGLFILDIFIIIIAPQFIKRYNLGKRFEIYFCSYFWGACGFRLFLDLSHLFYRVTCYFYDFYIIIIPITLYYLYKEHKLFLFYTIIILAYFSTIYRALRGISISGENSYDVYKFFFSIT